MIKVTRKLIAKLFLLFVLLFVLSFVCLPVAIWHRFKYTFRIGWRVVARAGLALLTACSPYQGSVGACSTYSNLKTWDSEALGNPVVAYTSDSCGALGVAVLLSEESSEWALREDFELGEVCAELQIQIISGSGAFHFQLWDTKGRFQGTIPILLKDMSRTSGGWVLQAQTKIPSGYGRLRMWAVQSRGRDPYHFEVLSVRFGGCP